MRSGRTTSSTRLLRIGNELRVLILRPSFFSICPGVESLEQAISHWEEALEAYQSGSGVCALPTAEEAEFCHSLEIVLKAAYALQDETEQ